MIYLLAAWIGGILALAGGVAFGMRCAPGFYAQLLQKHERAPLIVLAGLAFWPFILVKWHLENIPNLDYFFELEEPRYKLHNPREEPFQLAWDGPDPMTSAELECVIRLHYEGKLKTPVICPADLADLVGCQEHPRRIHDGGPCAACLPDPERGPDGRILHS